MIIIDFQHLSYRNLFTCMYNCKPRKKDGKLITEDYIQIYFYQMLQSLNKISNEFIDEYGEIVLAIDDRKNWRKEFAKKYYKFSRKKYRDESEINYNEFFQYQNELLNFLKSYVKVIQVEYAEADDIGYVLSTIDNEKNLLITSDKDWVQSLIDNLHTDLYDPIKKEFIKNSKSIQNDLKKKRLIHILIGDKVDEIPSVMYNVEFSKEFLNHLKNQSIKITPYEFNNLSEEEQEKIIENFEGDIFKKARFGEKTAEKLINNPSKFIKEKVKDKKQFYKNFKINRKLIDMKKIPIEIKNKIISIYNNTKLNEKNLNFIYDNNLEKCLNFKLGNEKIDNFENIMSFDSIKDLF